MMMRRLTRGVVVVAAALWAMAMPSRAAEDIVIADFEGPDYGGWKITGDAFGAAPARGTLPHQRRVTGFKGKGLVNTYLNGDRTTGMFTSPEFTIQRDYIVFLIGGGAHENTCVELLVDGKVVASQSGMDDERLSPAFFDVAKFKGKKAQLRIVDKATGGWGHVNVDHIVQSDTKPKVPKRGTFAKDIRVEKKLLLIPVQNGARRCNLELLVDGKAVRRYSTELAPDENSVDFYAYFTIEPYRGRMATVRAVNAPEAGFALIRQADELPNADTLYDEPMRPQLHFSQKVGWNNDPNGMVFYDGEWHLFFQHNPVGWKWGNMTWGHAVSKDLVHWEQLPDALFPFTMARGACFSGSAAVDENNTAGFQTGKEKVIVAALTDTGAGESIAYSNDRGRTFTWYEKNPVVKHSGRDPKIIWYAPGKHWVMAVFDQSREHGRNIAFYTSKDLKNWQVQSHLPGYFECPEIFELPVDGDKANTRWVVYAADAQYALGKFDGKTFTPEHKGKYRVHYGAYYASQTFSNPPDGRRIQIGWAQIEMPGMPFNQTFTFPVRLTLRTTPEGIRMFARPIKEIEILHKKKHTVAGVDLAPGSPKAVKVAGELFDIRAEFALGHARSVGLDIGGNRVVYDAVAGQLNGAPMQPVDGKVSMQVIVDRPMIEVCGNDGAVYITSGRPKRGGVATITAFADGGKARLVRLEAYELQSIWKKK